SLEYGPSVPAPDEESFYVPGCWMYSGAGYLWRPGYWNPSYYGYVWTPDYYEWTPAGCLFQTATGTIRSGTPVCCLPRCSFTTATISSATTTSSGLHLPSTSTASDSAIP